MNTLSFELVETRERSETEAEYLFVVVKPLLNGKSFFGGAGYLFDALQVLIVGAQAAELDIFTCGCGVAGCAGIHDECQITVDEANVTWSLPLVPFVKHFAPGVPVRLSFTRTGYVAALARLEADLEAIRLFRGLPLLVAPFAMVDDRDLESGSVPFSQYVTSERNRRAEWLARCKEIGSVE
jgi:hypothetical protein